MRTHPDCPYDAYPHRCTNKNWCVREKDDCNSTTADIRLRVGPYENTFRRPLKLLLRSLTDAITEKMDDGQRKESALEEILKAAQLVDRITNTDAVLNLDAQVIRAIEQLDEIDIKFSLDDDKDDVSSVVNTLLEDLSLIRKAYGDAINDLDEDYDEVEYQIEDVAVAKDILKSSLKDLEQLKISISSIMNNLNAAAA